MAPRTHSAVGSHELVRPAAVWASTAGVRLSAELALVPAAFETWLDAGKRAALVLRADPLFRLAYSLCFVPRTGPLACGLRVGSMFVRARRLCREHGLAAD